MRRTKGNSNELEKAIILLGILILLMANQLEAQTEVRQVVVSIPDRKLALVENGVVREIFPVAVGSSTTPSPSGSFTIVNRLENPTYYHPGKVIGPGPLNPLGTRWIGLNQKGYGIHGTNAPLSIGKAASHGCIRMAKADLEKLFTQVRTGDEVEIVSERNEETVSIFGGELPSVAVAQGPLAAPITAGQ